MLGNSFCILRVLLESYYQTQLMLGNSFSSLRFNEIAVHLLRSCSVVGQHMIAPLTVKIHYCLIALSWLAWLVSHLARLLVFNYFGLKTLPKIYFSSLNFKKFIFHF